MKPLARYSATKTLEGKSAGELAELYNEFNAIKRKEIQELIDAKASKEDIDAMRSTLMEAQAEQMKSLNETLKEYGVVLKRLSANPEEGKEETFSTQLRKALTDNAEKLKTMKEGTVSDVKANAFEFSIKAAGTMTTANISGGNLPVEDRLTGLNTVPSRRVRLMDVMGQRSTTSSLVSWVYQANKDGAAGQTAEGATKNQIDFDFVIASESIKKTTAFIKVSTEMLDDIDWLQSEIEQELMKEVLKALENTVYSGDGTGQNHNGIKTVASAFSAGDFAGAVDNANEVDVLTVAMNQIEIAQENEGIVDYIFMHPTDVTRLLLIKQSATDKGYIDRLVQVGSTMVLDGVPIIKTTLITAGDYLIGDFQLALYVLRQNIRIDIGLDGNDYSKNLRTVLGEVRSLTLVKNNDRTAFVAGTFATDKAALETA